MVNFTVYNPVRLVVGNQIKDELGPCLKKFGMNILLIYGKGSVKKYGYYNQIMNVLISGGFKVTEFQGIKPNAVIDDVRAAVKLG